MDYVFTYTKTNVHVYQLPMVSNINKDTGISFASITFGQIWNRLFPINPLYRYTPNISILFTDQLENGVVSFSISREIQSLAKDNKCSCCADTSMATCS